MAGVKVARIASSFARICIRAAAVVGVVMIYGFGLISGAGVSGLALTAVSTTPAEAYGGGYRRGYWGRRGWWSRGGRGTRSRG